MELDKKNYYEIVNESEGEKYKKKNKIKYYNYL